MSALNKTLIFLLLKPDTKEKQFRNYWII